MVRRKYALVLSGLVSCLVIYSFLWFWKNTNLFHPLDCGAFILKELQTAEYDSLFRGNEMTWVVDQFHVPQLFIKKSAVNSEYYSFQWNSKGKNLSLTYHYEKYRLYLSWQYSRVTVADMLRCLGNPEGYINYRNIFVDATTQEIMFLYPDIQVIVWAGVFNPQRNMIIDSETELNGLSKLPYSSINEQVLAFMIQSTNADLDTFLQIYKPWPEDFIFIDEEPVEIRP